MTRIVNVISLGAGVQSSALTLMAARGELSETPDFAVFADVGWEPPRVYEHLQWLEEECKKYGLKIIRASKGNLRKDFLESVYTFICEAERRQTRGHVMAAVYERV